MIAAPRRNVRDAWGTAEERFWANVDKSDECWSWTGHKSPRGYGDLRVDGKMMRAPRYSWTLHYGPIPAGLFVLHHCDNPPCVRPDHLFVGTLSDNSQDASRKRRLWMQTPSPVCRRGLHPFTPENTYVNARGRRHCRACHNAWKRDRRRRFT